MSSKWSVRVTRGERWGERRGMRLDSSSAHWLCDFGQVTIPLSLETF